VLQLRTPSAGWRCFSVACLRSEPKHSGEHRKQRNLWKAAAQSCTGSQFCGPQHTWHQQFARNHPPETGSLSPIRTCKEKHSQKHDILSHKAPSKGFGLKDVFGLRALRLLSPGSRNPFRALSLAPKLLQAESPDGSDWSET
jgi:hypothetical protein